MYDIHFSRGEGVQKTMAVLDVDRIRFSRLFVFALIVIYGVDLLALEKWLLEPLLS